MNEKPWEDELQEYRSDRTHGMDIYVDHRADYFTFNLDVSVATKNL